MILNRIKRSSKKNKTSWRKSTTFNDVEEFLDDQRHDEIAGGPVSQLTNDQLFFIDTNATAKCVPLKKKSQLDWPRSFQVLLPHSNVSDPITKRNNVRTKVQRQGIYAKLKAESKKLKKFSKIVSHKPPKKVKEIHVTDIWNEQSDEKQNQLSENEWILSHTKTHHRLTSKSKRKPKIKKIGPQSLPAIDRPHPGISFNPSFEDHQHLLQQLAESETKIIKDEKHLYNVTSKLFRKISNAENQESWLEEMSQGLEGLDKQLTTEEDPNNESEDSDYKPINLPVKNAKKTLKQRRKQREQRDLLFSRHIRAINKRKITDLRRLHALQALIKRREAKLMNKRNLKDVKRKMNETATKQLGPHKFEEPELDFNLPSEITGALRDTKVQGNILKDMFKSFQRRNIIRPTIPTLSWNRPRLKKFFKPGYKDNEWENTVAGH